MPAALQLAPCPTCSLVHEVPEVADGHIARCTRCRSKLDLDDPRDHALARTRTAALALAALLLYPFAISLPIVSVSRFGSEQSTSILASSIDLIRGGELVVGAVVIVCSIVIPFIKLTALLLISSSKSWLRERHAALTWRIVDHIGRWGMIDVMLAAVMIALLKAKDIVRIDVGPGLFVFSTCVLLSLAASAAFRPQALWSSR